MPGCVQTMVTHGVGTVEPYVKPYIETNVKPFIESKRKDYKSVDDWCIYVQDKYTKEVSPMIDTGIKTLDDKIDPIYERFPPREEIQSKFTETMEKVPEIIQNNSGLKQARGKVEEIQKNAEPFAHSLLDKILGPQAEGEDATVIQRLWKIPAALYLLFLTYVSFVLEYAKDTAAFAWSKVLVLVYWIFGQLEPFLENESVKLYKEQITSTGKHFYEEFSEKKNQVQEKVDYIQNFHLKTEAAKKLQEGKQLGEHYYTVFVARIPEIKEAAKDKGVPVEKIEAALITAKYYVAMVLTNVPESVVTFVEGVPVVGRVWSVVFVFITDDFEDAQSESFVSPASESRETRTSPIKAARD